MELLVLYDAVSPSSKRLVLFLPAHPDGAPVSQGSVAWYRERAPQAQSFLPSRLLFRCAGVAAKLTQSRRASSVANRAVDEL
jgi:hypothetical protein